MMIKVISFKICPFVQRVTALLEAKKLPYQIDFISLQDKPQWFLDISPTSQVPVLVTESGQALFESDAIVEYLDEIAAPLENSISPEQRAQDRAWSYQAAKHYLVQCSAMRSPDKVTLAERAEKLGQAFARVEQYFNQRAHTEGYFFKGNRLSNVDIAWLPLLYRASLIERHAGYDFLVDYPRVKAWQSALLETGLAEKSVSDDFEKLFTDFYLSERTYLGAGKCGKDMLNNICESSNCC